MCSCHYASVVNVLIVPWWKCQLNYSMHKFRISVNILLRTIRTIQFTLLTHLTISVAQSSSPVSLRLSSRLSKPKRDPDFQYMPSRIDQLDREMSAAGVSPTPRPLPQEQTSTINPIPPRPLLDTGLSASFLSFAEEIKLVELKGGIGAGGP